MPDRSPLPAPGSQLLSHFRASKRRLPLHPLEKAVLTAVAIHLCFLPWALGTMHVWSQLTSLGFSVLGLGIALIPRTYSGDLALGIPAQALGSGVQRPGLGNPGPQILDPRSRTASFRLNPLPRLLKFPIFWIGLALLGYIALQGYNPSWVWERNETTWWLRRVNDIPWLPTSIDTPFERFNLWRQFIIYASAWLTLCTVWIGFTRRRSLQLLLLTLVINGMLLTVVGFVCRLLRPHEFVLWFDQPLENVISFASFIYKNHAGAYLSLCASVCTALAALYYKRSLLKMYRSSPTVFFVLGGAMLLFAVIFTSSRGATILLSGYFVVSFVVFLVSRALSRSESTTHPIVPISVTLLVLLSLGYGASQLEYGIAKERFTQLIQGGDKDVSLRQREQAHVASKDMLSTHWQRGVGAGGFRYLYPEYIKHYPQIYKGGRLYWEHAHNDWFQIPIELGLSGTLILFVMASYVLRQLFALSIWRDLPALLLCIGLGQTLLQALFDFPFQNPAVLVTWLSLLVLSLRWTELEGGV